MGDKQPEKPRISIFSTRLVPAAVKIAGVYLIISAAWILFSDQIVALLFFDSRQLTVIQSYKGMAFVLVTAVLLYGLVQAEIAQRNRAEMELKRISRAYQMTGTTNQTIVHAVTEQELLDSVCEKLADLGDFPLVWVGILRPGAERLEHVTAAAGQALAELSLVAPTQEQIDDRVEIPADRALRMGQVVVANCREEPCMVNPWCEVALEQGIEVVVALPMSVNKRVVGVLNVAISSTSLLLEKELILLSSLANDLAFGLLTIKTMQDHADALAAIRRERDRAQTYLDVTGGMFVVIDKDYSISLVNNRGCEILGYKPGELLGKDWFDTCVPEEDRSHRRTMFDRSMAGDKPLEVVGETSVLKRDGAVRYMTWYNGLLYGEDGELTGVLSSGTDVTERREAEMELRRLNEELEHRVIRRTAALKDANEELEAFAYSISHDLRAPLRAIDGFAYFLEQDEGPQMSEKGQHFLQRIRGNVVEMNSLISGLLAFSRSSSQPLDVMQVDTRDVVQQVLDDLHAISEAREVEIVLGDLPPCQADRQLLKQVYTNLLSNALKYSRPREKARIEVGAATQAGETVYFVKDNGVGFDAEAADKLFGVFQRFHSSEDFEGVGVGLALVQRIVRRHGGRIWAEAAVDEGAAFYFTIRGRRDTPDA